MRTTVIAMIGMLLLVGACGTDEAAEPAGAPPEASIPAAPTITNSPPVITTPPHVEPRAVAVVAVHPDLEYYGACGNETVDVDGTRFYPLLHDDAQALDTARYPVVAPVGLRSVGVESARVAPPGPGDDIGTLIVYDDGIARFESESGWVIWLTTTPLTYHWEC